MPLTAPGVKQRLVATFAVFMLWMFAVLWFVVRAAIAPMGNSCMHMYPQLRLHNVFGVVCLILHLIQAQLLAPCGADACPVDPAHA